MDKKYINILHVPKPDMGLQGNHLNNRLKLENTISTKEWNKLTLSDIANGKAVCRMSQISQPFLSTKMLILQLC